MHLTHKGLRVDGSAVGRVAPPRKRDAARRSKRAALELARLPDDRTTLTSGGRAFDARRRPVAAGQLVVRWERRPGALIIWLSGTLDRATTTLLDHELDHKLDVRAGGAKRLIVDLTGLEFIDTPGLDGLMRTQQRARARCAAILPPRAACRPGPAQADRHGAPALSVGHASRSREPPCLLFRARKGVRRCRSRAPR